MALILVGPLALIAAVLIGVPLKWLKLVPVGVTPVRASVMLWAILVVGFVAESDFEEMVVRPWRYQAAHLGGQYGTPLNMRHYYAAGFQDFVLQTSYQLTPAQAAQLRPRCGKPTQAFGLSRCELHSWWGGKYDDEALVMMLSRDNQLHIVEIA